MKSKSFTIGIIIQARTGSTRLPSKVLYKIQGKEILQIIIDRLKVFTSKNDIKLIIATTTKKNDQKIIAIAKKNSIDYFTGPEKNVLKRYYLASKKFNLDWIVRITSDCPFVDTDILKKMLNKDLNRYDFISNVIERTYPKGLDLEIFSSYLLGSIYENAISKYDKEHVTNYLYKNLNKIKFYSYKSKKNRSHLRLTLDTLEDFNHIKNIFKKNNYDFNSRFNIVTGKNDN